MGSTTDCLTGGRHTTLLQECFEFIWVIRHGAMSDAVEGDRPPRSQSFEFAEGDAQEACGFLGGDIPDSTSHPTGARDPLHGILYAIFVHAIIVLHKCSP